MNQKQWISLFSTGHFQAAHGTSLPLVQRGSAEQEDATAPESATNCTEGVLVPWREPLGKPLGCTNYPLVNVYKTGITLW